MEKLKSSSSRLIRLFKKSRDLSLSRENWKQRAMKAEKELRILRTDSVDGQKKGKKFQNQ